MTGKRLREIRDRLELTQAEFALELKITRNSVARMERGEVLITAPMELLITYLALELSEDERAHQRPGRSRGHEKEKLECRSD